MKHLKNLITEEEYQAGKDTTVMKINRYTGERQVIGAKYIKDQLYFKDENGDICAAIPISWEEIMSGRETLNSDDTNNELNQFLDDNGIQL